MEKKIREYIELIFADAPDCAQTREMKEEMYANVCDRYNDLIKEGKSESAAYNISISGIGDISELIDSIKAEQGAKFDSDFDNPYTDPAFKRSAKVTFTAEEKAEIEKYRVRRGIMNSVAVSLYILCWVPLVLLASLADVWGWNSDAAGTLGLGIMMLMVAAATVLMIMKSSIKSMCLKGVKVSVYSDDDDDDDDDDEDDEDNKKSKKKNVKRRNPALQAISSLLWTLTVVVYLLLGFLLGAWHPGWIVFIITVAVDNIVEAIFELAGKKYI